ncbi:MAG: hypothetical protein GY938_22600 [Ketobacter sp.]|nr:hypothetical protein [Ketobacter sp.]
MAFEDLCTGFAKKLFLMAFENIGGGSEMKFGQNSCFFGKILTLSPQSDHKGGTPRVKKIKKFRNTLFKANIAQKFPPN